MFARVLSVMLVSVFVVAASHAHAQGAAGAALIMEGVKNLGTEVAVPITNSITGGVTSGGSIKNNVQVKGDVIQVTGDNSTARTNVGGISGVTAKKDIENTTIVNGKVVNASGNNSTSEVRVGGIGK